MRCPVSCSVRCGYRRSTRLLFVTLIGVACLSVTLLLQKIEPATVYFLRGHEHAQAHQENLPSVFNRHFDFGQFDTAENLPKVGQSDTAENLHKVGQSHTAGNLHTVGQSDTADSLHKVGQSHTADRLHKAGLDRTVKGQLKVGEPVKGQLKVGEPVKGQLKVGEPVKGKLKVGEPVKGQLKVGESVKGQLKVGETLKGQLKVFEPVKGQLKVGEPVKGQLKVGEPVKGQLKVGEPVKGQLKVGEPVKGQLKMGEPVKDLNVGVLVKGKLRVGEPVKSQLKVGDPVKDQKKVGEPVKGQLQVEVPVKGELQVVVPVKGGLGNRMFQYASLLGIAHMNNRTPVYNTSSGLNKTFRVTHLHHNRSRNFKTVSERHFASYDPRMEKLPGVNVQCMQYLQSWKYFHFMQADIRREFTFTQPVKDAVAELLRKHSNIMAGKVKVGVHVRGGDLLVEQQIKRGYHVAPLSYVRKAMDFMRHKHDDVIFIFVTQNPGWCRKEFNCSECVVADTAPADVHLGVLASCDHVIMTVGTYGWWGGYLSGGDVVYWWDPKESLHDPPLPVEIRQPKDYYLPSWIPLTG